MTSEASTQLKHLHLQMEIKQNSHSLSPSAELSWDSKSKPSAHLLSRLQHNQFNFQLNQVPILKVHFVKFLKRFKKIQKGQHTSMIILFLFVTQDIVTVVFNLE